MNECTYCGEQLQDEEIESPRRDDTENVMCDDCYHDRYEATCPICEEYFEKATEVKNYRFAITKEIIETEGVEYEDKPMVPGIYSIKEWNFYHGDIFGFIAFWNGSIELIKEIDFPGEFCEEICFSCVRKYNG